MKILHISLAAPYNDYWGYQDNLLPLYQHKLGHEVTIITTNLIHGKDGNIEEVKPNRYKLTNGINVIRCKKNKKKGIIINKIVEIFNYYNIYHLICEIQPDMIMVHGLVSVITNQVVRYIKNNNPQCKLIGDNHLDDIITSLNKSKKAKFIGFLYRIMNYRWIKYYDKIYGVTPWRTEYAHSVFGIPYSKLDTLVMGADTEKINFSQQGIIKQKIRNLYGIDLNNFVFISGGKLENNKKIIESMNAFKKIQNINLKFIIFGSVSNEIKDDFNKLLASDNRFKYIGFIDSEKVYDLFLASDCGVFPGRHSVLWEQAVGSGLPCIFKKYVSDGYVNVGGNCILLDNSTEEEIYDAMFKVCHNDNYFINMKNVAQTKGIKEFSYYEIARKSLQ